MRNDCAEQVMIFSFLTILFVYFVDLIASEDLGSLASALNDPYQDQRGF